MLVSWLWMHVLGSIHEQWFQVLFEISLKYIYQVLSNEVKGNQYQTHMLQHDNTKYMNMLSVSMNLRSRIGITII